MMGRTIIALIALGLMVLQGCASNSTSPPAQQSQSVSAQQPATTQPVTVVDSNESPALTIPITPNNDKPGALEGAPKPQVGPSPESLVSKKICPSCNTVNDPKATTCVKCGKALQ